MVTVENKLVTPEVKIFVTFRGNPKAFWWISKQEAGRFAVSLSQNATEDVTFDYWLVGVATAQGGTVAEPVVNAAVVPDPNLTGAITPTPAPAPSSEPAPTPAPEVTPAAEPATPAPALAPAPAPEAQPAPAPEASPAP